LADPGAGMSTGWIILILILLVVLAGVLPLISKRGLNLTPLPPRKETLRDWRSEK
jgi:hypothetical protein